MKQIEKIFINTFFDLKERFEKRTEYDLLRASGLVRQLLVDSNSLVEQVNKNYKLKIRYRVQKRFEFPPERVQPDGTVWKALYGMVFISPGEDSNHVELLTKDGFLKYKLLYNSDVGFTVLDIIKISAHKYGGIHSEDITEFKDKLLDTTSSNFIFNDSHTVFHSMHSIIEICLKALQPLLDEVLQKHNST